MKSKIHFDIFCISITILVILTLGAAIVANTGHPKTLITISVITVLTLGAGLYYCPVYVSADREGLNIHRILSGDKAIKYSEIAKIDTCYPSAGGIRLCGSGGFFGYWGYFSDIMIGQYFGYYADRNQCFYIRLKNKRQYVISCENHIEMVNLIQKSLAEQG